MMETVLGFLGIGGAIAGLGGLLGLAPIGLGVLGVGAGIFGFFRGGLSSPIVLLGVGLIVAAGFTYHFFTVASFEKKIADTIQQMVDVKNENAALKIDRANLIVSNSSLEAAIKLKDKVNTELIASIEKLQRDDDEIEANLQALHERINNSPVVDVTDDGAIELFVNEANKDLKCELANFTNFNGQCLHGKWIPN